MNDVEPEAVNKRFWPGQKIARPPGELQPLGSSGLSGTTKPDSRTGQWSKLAAAILPHEWIFGSFLFLTGLRLAIHGGLAAAWAGIFLGCWVAAIGIFFWAERNLTPARWRVRLLFYPVAMGLAFFAMGHAVPLLGYAKVDRMLLGWDRALLGETPAVAWESWLRPWLEDLTMLSYLFFFYYLIAGPGRYCLRDLRLFRKCIVGLFTLYGLAFTGYTVMPAGGPHRWMTFATPLHGWVLDLTLRPVNAASNSVDVFPSVHVAATLYLLLFDWHHFRRRFWWSLLPCALLWFSTMYLRFHYFVDLLAGVAAALAGWWMAQSYAAATRGQPMLTRDVNDRVT